MRPAKTCLALAALAAAVVALPARASSTAASSASDSASAAVGSLSDSVRGSSNSSSGERKTAAGDYRIVDLARLAGRPGLHRMRLEALAEPDRTLEVELPEGAIAAAALVVGQVVSVRQRPYGLEFARGGAAFYLALEDEWLRELRSHPVTL